MVALLSAEAAPSNPTSVNDRRSTRILKTGAALLSVQAITWLASLVGILFVPRYLAESDYGLLNAASSGIALATILASFGTANHIIKQVAREPAEAGSVIVHALVLRIGIGAVLATGAFAWLALSHQSAVVIAVVAFAVTGALGGLISDTLLSALQGNQTLGRVSLAVGCIALTGQCAVVAVLVAGGGVVGVAAVLFASAVFVLVATTRVSLQTFARPVGLSRLELRAMALVGPAYLAWELGLRIYSTVDVLILSSLSGTRAVGEYAFADRLVAIPVFASTVVMSAIYPALAAAARNDRAWFSEVLANGTRVAFLLAMPAAVGIGVLAGDLTHVLTGGQFVGSGAVIAIMALHIPAAAVHTILGTALFATDRQGQMARIAWAASIFAVAANFAAIPAADSWFGNPAIGPAVVTVITEAIVGAFVWRLSWPLMRAGDRRTLFSSMLRTGLASACCGLAAWLLAGPAGIVAAIAAGVLVYVAAVGALRLVTRADVQAALSLVRT